MWSTRPLANQAYLGLVPVLLPLVLQVLETFFTLVTLNI
jgi:hypothetical protein